MALQVYSQGKALKITNVADGRVLDLARSSILNNAEIITYKWYGTDNQKWVAQKAANAWCLTSLVQGSENNKCIKQDPLSNRVVHEVCDNSLGDQQWYGQPVSVNSEILMIINYKSGMALTSNGSSNQVTCQHWDNTNPRQHWSFEEV